MPQGARSKQAELEAQARKMAQELAEFHAEGTELRNQEVTVRRLEEKARGNEARLAEQVRSCRSKRQGLQRDAGDTPGAACSTLTAAAVGVAGGCRGCSTLHELLRLWCIMYAQSAQRQVCRRPR